MINIQIEEAELRKAFKEYTSKNDCFTDDIEIEDIEELFFSLPSNNMVTVTGYLADMDLYIKFEVKTK